MKLEILKNGRPRGWAVSSGAILFCAGVYVAGMTSDAIMARVVQGEMILYAILAFACTGTTFKKPLEWLGNRQK